MKDLFNLKNKTIYSLGLMSGTILDGIDIALVKHTNLNNQTSHELISFKTYPYNDELKQRIKDVILKLSPEDTEFVTNNRQQDCLEKARTSLTQAYMAATVRELQDLISIDVKQALLYLDEITGEVITDDILNNIFDNFCIGK